MLIKKASKISSNEVTPESIYLRRREFLGGSLALSGLTAMAGLGVLSSSTPVSAANLKALTYKTNNIYTTKEPQTPFEDASKYNNFYEFGTDKKDPAENSSEFKTDPWSIEIEGEVEKTGRFNLEDILKPHPLEERIYRIRCVEAWSMVIPWLGFPLADLIQRFKPTSRAKFVEFVTLLDPEQMLGQRSRFSTIDWPYVEGLRMDEAMHPLTILSVGMYGKTLPPQNGAPIRLVVPWKYGFKSIKSIVKIRFRETPPPTTWSQIAPKEYGFYANVNPEVDHPRWSQKSERRLPSSLFSSNTLPTRKFNGYEEEVAHLYAGMNLAKFY